jgi:hypothetical protein
MTLLSDLTADIADDIDDTSGEYGAQILKAVQGAQRDCERSTYYFNETRDVTFSTVIGQQIYDSTANANIPTLVHIQRAYITDGGGQIDFLRLITPDLMELLSDSSAATGEPYNYTYFAQKIRIYPIPDAVYTIRLQLGPYRLSVLSNPSDNNAWLDEAYDLMKARAKYRLYKNSLKDPALAAEALNDWRDQDLLLAAETSSRNASGFIQATSF